MAEDEGEGPGPVNASKAAKATEALKTVTGAAALANIMNKLRLNAEALAVPFESAAKSATDFAKAMGVGETNLKGFAEAATDIDKLRAELQQSTGRGEEFAEMAVNLQAKMTDLGVATSETQAAFSELYNNYAEFSLLAPKAQNAITQQALGFTRLGVSIQTSTKNFDIYRKGLGMSIDQSRKASDDMKKFALSIEMAPKVIEGAFGPAMSNLAKYGQSGISVFKGLAVQSKATGIAINTLLQIASGFDTFEQAAQKAGQLNAMLGGNLINSVDMLTASEEQRVEMIRESIRASGQSWEMMDRFQRKGVATVLGISDMTDAMKLFGTEQATWDEIANKADPAIVAQQDLTKAIRDGVTLTQQWSAEFNRLSNIFGKAFLPVARMFTSWARIELHKSAGVIDHFAAGVENIFKWWRALDGDFKKSIITIGEVIVKASLFSLALGKVKEIAGPLMGLLTNRWSIMITGLATVYLHWNNLGALWDKIKAKFVALDVVVMSFFDKYAHAGEGGFPMLRHVKDLYVFLKDNIPAAMRGLGDWFDVMLPKAQRFFDQFVKGPLKNLWEDFVNNRGFFQGGMEGALNRVFGVVMQFFGDIKAVVMGVVAKFYGFLEKMTISPAFRALTGFTAGDSRAYGMQRRSAEYASQGINVTAEEIEKFEKAQAMLASTTDTTSFRLQGGGRNAVGSSGTTAGSYNIQHNSAELQAARAIVKEFEAKTVPIERVGEGEQWMPLPMSRDSRMTEADQTSWNDKAAALLEQPVEINLVWNDAGNTKVASVATTTVAQLFSQTSTNAPIMSLLNLDK
jgi:hypothetical protein